MHRILLQYGWWQGGVEKGRTEAVEEVEKEEEEKQKG